MRVEVNGTRLFFDVEGAKLVPDGPTMREKQTLILLHGGPGADHSFYKPAFSQFADICQVVYLDHRGNGRSDREPRDRWNLAQWGDDVHAFCRALEIEKPIVFGSSFGGFVAMSYATRHPEHPGKVILTSTKASARSHADRCIELFTQAGGAEVGELARRWHAHGLTPDLLPLWVATAVPLYTRRREPVDPEARQRIMFNRDVLLDFEGPTGEGSSFDMLDDLRHVRCPVLVLGGEADPQTPIEYHEDIAAALPPDLVRFERVPNAGHGVYGDEPRVFDIIRDCILS